MTTAERLHAAANANISLPGYEMDEAADELEALTTALSAWKTSFGTQQLSHAVAERDDLKAKLSQVEADAAEMREALKFYADPTRWVRMEAGDKIGSDIQEGDPIMMFMDGEDHPWSKAKEAIES